MNSYKTQACKEADRLFQNVWEVARYLYQHPETAYQEHGSARKQIDFLREMGFDTTAGVGGMDTSFVARWQGAAEGKQVAFLTEYDALPEIGHACGHHLIAGASLLGALAMKAVMEKNGLGGRVLVVGAPAEENGGGKIPLAKQNFFDDCACCLMAHPAYYSVAQPKSLCNLSLAVEFFGKASHAGSNPEEGVSALTALRSLFQNLDGLRMHFTPDARVHGIIVEGGVVENIIPAYAKGIFTLRAREKATMKKLRESFDHCVEAASLSTGAANKVEEKFYYAALTEYPGLLEKLHENWRTLGEEIPLRDEDGDYVSTDAGNVSEVAPLIHPMFSILPAGEKCALHTPAFARAADTALAYERMRMMGKVLAMTGLDALTAEETE